MSFTESRHRYDISYCDETVDIKVIDQIEYHCWRKIIDCPMNEITTNEFMNIKLDPESIFNLFVGHANRIIDRNFKIIFPSKYVIDDIATIEIHISLAFSDCFHDKKIIRLEPMKLTNEELINEIKNLKQCHKETIEQNENDKDKLRDGHLDGMYRRIQKIKNLENKNSKKDELIAKYESDADYMGHSINHLLHLHVTEKNEKNILSKKNEILSKKCKLLDKHIIDLKGNLSELQYLVLVKK